MTIHERLAAFSPSEITVQWLHESMTRVNTKKRCTEVTFATNQITPGDVVGDSMKPCIILWIDRAAMERVRNGATQPQAEKAQEEQPKSDGSYPGCRACDITREECTRCEGWLQWHAAQQQAEAGKASNPVKGLQLTLIPVKTTAAAGKESETTCTH